MSNHELVAILQVWKSYLADFSRDREFRKKQVLDNVVKDAEMVLNGGSTLTRVVAVWEQKLRSARLGKDSDAIFVLRNVLEDVERMVG